jgi:hypothetical protein
MPKRVFVVMEISFTLEDDEDLSEVLDALEDAEIGDHESLPEILAVQVGDVDEDGDVMRFTHTNFYVDSQYFHTLIADNARLPNYPEEA